VHQIAKKQDAACPVQAVICGCTRGGDDRDTVIDYYDLARVDPERVDQPVTPQLAEDHAACRGAEWHADKESNRAARIRVIIDQFRSVQMQNDRNCGKPRE
jgi:hypothetical protein